MYKETRTLDQLRIDYEIEKELANRLRNASQDERRHLYASLYDEFFRRVPRTPQLIQKASLQEKEQTIAKQLRFIKPYLTCDVSFLEVGPGDCGLSFEVAKSVKQVYAIDVSVEITKNSSFPSKFHLIISDGCTSPLPDGSIDVAYSNQLMEHLHPDDAVRQLQEIYRVLIHGGKYICITPNRLSGPHDISMYFDRIATGFHLREYTTLELVRLFKNAGFSRSVIYVGGKGRYVRFPSFLVFFYEMILDRLPYKFRRLIVRSNLFKLLLGIRLIATK